MRFLEMAGWFCRTRKRSFQPPQVASCARGSMMSFSSIIKQDASQAFLCFHRHERWESTPVSCICSGPVKTKWEIFKARGLRRLFFMARRRAVFTLEELDRIQ